MSLTAKEYLKKFFTDTFDYYTFERMQNFQNSITEFNFAGANDTTFEEFKQHNFKIILELDNIDANCYARLCKNIKNKKIVLCDEESCVEFHAHTFYFNYKGELVIMNPR